MSRPSQDQCRSFGGNPSIRETNQFHLAKIDGATVRHGTALKRGRDRDEAPSHWSLRVAFALGASGPAWLTAFAFDSTVMVFAESSDPFTIVTAVAACVSEVAPLHDFRARMLPAAH